MKLLRIALSGSPCPHHKPSLFPLLFAAMALLAPLAAWSGNLPFDADAATLALYHFDRGANSGDALRDASANALQLTVAGNVQFLSDNLAWMNTPSGTSAHFSGAADTLSVHIPDRLMTSAADGKIAPFTIEARLFIHAFPDDGAGTPLALLARDDKVLLDFGLDAKSGMKEPRLRARNPANKGYVTILSERDSARMLTRDEWHLLMLAVDAQGGVSAYVDNVRVNSARAGFSRSKDNDWTLTLGGFVGDLDELRISSGVRPLPASAPSARFSSYFQEVKGETTQLPLELDYDGIAPDITWGTESGPGKVAFSGQGVALLNGVKQAWVNAQFPAPGKYVIRADVSDASSTARDYMVVKVWPSSGATMGKKVLVAGLGPSSALLQDMVTASGDTQSLVKTDAVPGRRIKSFWYEAVPDNTPQAANFHDAHYLRDSIDAQDWDVVVLPLFPHSGGKRNAMAEEREDISYAKIFARYLRHHGARLLLCACYRSSPEAASAIAQAAQAKIAPVHMVYGNLIAARTAGISGANSAQGATGKAAYVDAYTVYFSLFGHAPRAYAMPYGNFRQQLRDTASKAVTGDPALYFDTWSTP